MNIYIHTYIYRYIYRIDFALFTPGTMHYTGFMYYIVNYISYVCISFQREHTVLAKLLRIFSKSETFLQKG